MGTLGIRGKGGWRNGQLASSKGPARMGICNYGQGAAIPSKGFFFPYLTTCPTYRNMHFVPLRSKLNWVGKLAQLVGGLELEPSETELRSISKEMTSFKTRVHSSQNAYRIRQPGCGDKCTRAPSRGQRSHDKRSEVSSQLLRCLGVVQEGSEAISMETPTAEAWRLRQLRPGDSAFSFKWGSGGDYRGCEGEEPQTRGRDETSRRPPVEPGHGPANDAGWPTVPSKVSTWNQ